MARKAKAAAGPPLSESDLKVLERLVDGGLLVAKPQQPSAKPRKVTAAALAHDGRRIILWLSRNTTELG
jgi:hypothetical protein